MGNRFKELWRRIRLAIHVLTHGEPRASKSELEAVRGVLAGRVTPGIPCPRCRQRITVDIAVLLAKSSATCAVCGLKLQVDWEEDARARRALERVEQARAEIARIRNFHP
jgi:hypothetical protein